MSVTTPIPKPPAGQSQFANLHLKLKMKKSVYESYRVNNINIVLRLIDIFNYIFIFIDCFF